MNQIYKRQVALLLDVLPEVAKETCFALHGGTAINLFIRDMPKLSVDIDLTYVPIENRETSLGNIAKALDRIKSNIEKVIPSVHIVHNIHQAKLLISARGVTVKLEVNLIGRGLMGESSNMPLCTKAQNEFNAFCAVNIVSVGQLYGGKICAALDRQHPRDMFDVKYLLNNEGFTDEIKKGFFFRLLSSERPINEVLFANFQDQRAALANQFAGMTEDDFSYEEYEEVRKRLFETIHQSLTEEDKRFLLSVKAGTPDWSIHDFERYPAIAWKLQNLNRLKETNVRKHNEQYEALKRKLDNI